VANFSKLKFLPQILWQVKPAAEWCHDNAAGGLAAGYKKPPLGGGWFFKVVRVSRTWQAIT
jgi:hypothetical protein